MLLDLGWILIFCGIMLGFGLMMETEENQWFNRITGAFFLCGVISLFIGYYFEV